ncbi:hypothetical protein PPERSA_01357 [Pseudocohnilembus persalinus]|uniref:Uncharacterized protein n=1 Tax=Pseudocohnilembus persalinus TaxID=266149 RepID=A0A0V0QGX9_PSEPJ|nr:hypothetical protein PPERSA_01357 [Pseudocohnilembus persalinus]|eukprot:KRX01454.1 hypothetical protein PPERSA_01357 [Pseudocohnilembus persalinus]
MAQGNLTDLQYYNKIKRRFPYKQPQAMKYSFILGGFTGLIHSVLAKRLNYFVKHFLLVPIPIYLIICKEDYEVLYKYRHLEQEWLNNYNQEFSQILKKNNQQEQQHQ